ncbi:Mitochondrial import inner membrane translocase subunit TIM22 [Cyberlindnera jadinii]|uniref:Mitochondrial import inner membrane translocase subunit TIM22 n=1 Tax=Cyberlindnera jadinii (strain ATCC 18201 / CBS 1600 / BCRC 20928 / JCM 3617 / NBRC 0987 / NRRL Y-1542) TaxID=983966 RepID=A0A0H5C6D9_CYBJN|nr:Mitochondrial import inner membrane translocase subunit TIM22 [Cyberlindnera jadinii]
MSYRGFGLETASTAPKKSINEMSPEEQAEEGARQMVEFMMSCPGKSAISAVTGFALGGVFGLFMASMAYDVPIGNNAAGHISDLPFKQQMKLQFTDMGKRSWSSAKNFGYIGMIYSGVECGVESLRAKNDIYNGVAAGCITGGGLAFKSGPQAAAIGCAGFAAFSTASEYNSFPLYLSQFPDLLTAFNQVDLYMRSEHEKPPTNDYDD